MIKFYFMPEPNIISQPFYQNSLDYLFVEEQLNISTDRGLRGIAKNIILIGDQMQLGQPTQVCTQASQVIQF